MQTNEIEDQLTTCIALAQKNTEASWSEIDTQLPKFCSTAVFLAWAKANICDADAALRDLAASIFETTDTPLTTKDITNLVNLMETDEGYPGFRAACALAKRRENENIISHITAIQQKLEMFSDDYSVADIAEAYLINIITGSNTG